MQNATPEGFRLSPQQKYLWTLQQATTVQPYRVIATLLIDGKLNSDELRQSLREVVSRHEILRTTFHRPPGIKTPFQVVSEDPRFTWLEVDLSDLDSARQPARLDQYFEAERKQLFDFEQGPLLRASYLKLADDRHALIVTLPALCADQRSIWNLADELQQSYERRAKPKSDLEQPIQFADFAEWQNGFLEAKDKVAEQANAFWKQQQALIPNRTLAVPLEKRLQETRSFDRQSIAFPFDTDLVDKIETLTREHQTSAAVVLLACWKALLSRLTGQSDVVVWTYSDGRKIEDLRTAIGPYAKYLPVFCPSGRTFSEYLKQTRVAMTQVEEWQEYFDPLAQADHASSNEAADMVAFAFQEAPATHDVSDTAFSITQRFICTQPFKLKLSFTTEEKTLRSEIEYNSQVLECDSVNRIARYFRQLLSRVVQDPEVEIRAIEILDDREKRDLLFEFNQTAADYPQSRCIHELFEEQVRKTPDAPAVVFEDNMLSFDELNKRSNQLAHFLQSRGVGPGSRVSLCMKRSAEMVVGLLGILKAGGAYVPLNPDHPKARLEVQLTQAQAAICLANRGEIGPFESSEVIDLERNLPHLNNHPVANPKTVSAPQNHVYLIFTSGSTGLPKGVAIRHQSLVNYSTFILNKLASDAPLNFATVSTISADLGNTCIFPSLISGGCLHILSDEVATEGTLFARYVSDHSIDVVKIVPSHLNALIATLDGSVLPRKHLFLGGETLSWELINRLSQLAHTCKITNHYGPTETTIGSLTYDIDENYISRYSLTVPIGRPIANTRVYILDKHRKPVPQGVVGELFIGGLGVADGYWNQPTETANRFVPDPFSSNPDDRLYQTGDLVKQLPDGAIEFIGRDDHQVKVRGYRVELAEVEAALEEHADVRQAVVVVRPESDSQLVAYLIVSGAKSPSHDDLRRTLAQKLPNYMIPSAFVFLESFPLTANGKLNRVALPSPDETRPELQKAFVAPRTASEKQIAEIWSSVLKLKEVGIHDDFFELGGHSLLATQVVARVRKAFQLDLPLRSLFEFPTIAEFAGRIETAKDAELSKLLGALEALSDEEAQLLLASENAKHNLEK